MNFKPGFHRAAMEYNAHIKVQPIIKVGRASGKAIMVKWHKSANVLRAAIMDNIDSPFPDYEIEEQIEGILAYLAHTELHGWDE